MLTCRICGCICDPSDLQNGVCDDCRTEQAEKAEKQERLAQMMNAECEQIELKYEIKERED